MRSLSGHPAKKQRISGRTRFRRSPQEHARTCTPLGSGNTWRRLNWMMARSASARLAYHTKALPLDSCVTLSYTITSSTTCARSGRSGSGSAQRGEVYGCVAKCAVCCVPARLVPQRRAIPKASRRMPPALILGLGLPRPHGNTIAEGLRAGAGARAAAGSWSTPSVTIAVPQYCLPSTTSLSNHECNPTPFST